jgi:LmbE family N-acetylglucosaminyl deacetylase
MDPRVDPAGGGRGGGVSAQEALAPGPGWVRAEPAPLPAARARPPRGRVLALAPHADDEVLGCGGTLALHAEQGDSVRVVVAFDGDGGARGADEARARRTEARTGGRRLGVRDYVFLGHPEGHAPRADELERGAARLAQEIEAFRPDVVYAPWIGEHHVDHHVLSRAARSALCAVRFAGEAWGYEVWTPLSATLVVDVTASFEQKLAALCAHASQLALADLLHRTAGLGAQRSAYLGPRGRQGEAFAPLLDGFPADRGELDLLSRLWRGRQPEVPCTSAS